MPTTGFWSDHPDDQWDNTGAEEEQVPPKTETRTEVDAQFWRESEQRWVDHVLIRASEIRNGGLRWRYREVTVTTTVGRWRKGRP